jgi:hypothetical protein
MPRAFLLPRVDHLSAEPQLAALAVLETAANVAILALGAGYPELALLEVDPHDPLELRAAADLIARAHDLDAAITRYRRDLAERHECERHEADLLPF